MKGNTAPRRKTISRGLGMVIILIAAAVIIVVAYMGTRPGGFKGQMTYNQKMEVRAKMLGYKDAAEMAAHGGPRAGKKGQEETPVGGGGVLGGTREQPAGEQGK